ncbi:hypothetical protein PF006_g14646, partial [Phytophthora fragariae]
NFGLAPPLVLKETYVESSGAPTTLEPVRSER